MNEEEIKDQEAALSLDLVLILFSYLGETRCSWSCISSWCAAWTGTCSRCRGTPAGPCSRATVWWGRSRIRPPAGASGWTYWGPTPGPRCPRPSGTACRFTATTTTPSTTQTTTPGCQSGGDPHPTRSAGASGAGFIQKHSTGKVSEPELCETGLIPDQSDQVLVPGTGPRINHVLHCKNERNWGTKARSWSPSKPSLLTRSRRGWWRRSHRGRTARRCSCPPSPSAGAGPGWPERGNTTEHKEPSSAPSERS